MARISVLGGTGYGGEAVVREAARRGHTVTSYSRRPPEQPVDGRHLRHRLAAGRRTSWRGASGTPTSSSRRCPRGATCRARSRGSSTS